MIHLAQKDIQHTWLKFIITAMGVGMLLGIVLIMMGVYRGMISDAQALLHDISADIWVVQKNTLGPFAEASRIHEDLRKTLQSTQGIQSVNALTFQNIQLHGHKTPVRVTLIGYDLSSPIVPFQKQHILSGRPIYNSHYELMVSAKTGFKVGETLTIGRNAFKIVGELDKSAVSSGGDPLIYMSLQDAQEIQFSYSNERTRTDEARGISSKNAHLVNTIVARLKPGYSAQAIAHQFALTQHKTVYTNTQQTQILTDNLIKMASKQIGMFTVILILVSVIIIALIIYTMTLEKIKEISIMKLIGIPNWWGFRPLFLVIFLPISFGISFLNGWL